MLFHASIICQALVMGGGLGVVETLCCRGYIYCSWSIVVGEWLVQQKEASLIIVSGIVLVILHTYMQ